LRLRRGHEKRPGVALTPGLGGSIKSLAERHRRLLLLAGAYIDCSFAPWANGKPALFPSELVAASSEGMRLDRNMIGFPRTEVYLTNCFTLL